MRTAVIFIGICIFLNGLIPMLFGNRGIGYICTLLIGLLLIAPAVFIKATRRIMARHISKFIMAFVAFFCVAAAFGTVALLVNGNVKTVTYKEDYLLVLGCGVKGETPSKQLASRLDTALEYCEKNKDGKIIVSGGRGKGERITEAEAMRRYLVKRGIDDERIISEDKSTSTAENFVFSNRLLDGGFGSHSVAFVTSDYHVYRADSIARYRGFYMNYIGAPTPWYDVVPSSIREMLAIGQSFVLKK